MASVQQHGKRFRFRMSGAKWSPSYDTAEEAERELRNYEEGKTDTGSQIVESLIEEYVSTRFGNKEATTQATARSNVKMIAEVCPRVRDITQTGVFKCCEDLKSSTAKVRIKHARWFLEWLEDYKGYKSPEIKWKKLNRDVDADDAKEKNFFNDRTIKQLLGWLEGMGNKRGLAMVKFLIFSGQRIGAAVSLNFSHLDLESRTITVPHDIEKTDKDLKIPLPQNLVTEMYLAFDWNERMKGEGKDGALFINFYGNRWSAPGFSNSFVDWSMKAGLGHRNVHLLRAYAWYSIYRISGFNLELTKKFAGWNGESYKFYVGEMEDEKRDYSDNYSEAFRVMVDEEDEDKRIGFYHRNRWYRFESVEAMTATKIYKEWAKGKE